ncbi:MAG: hypothetical protein JNJ73_09180 [Hyphomonadaceae bacterium]|nr:hypothetical protein [Hyphomonadaceae bacterium]
MRGALKVAAILGAIAALMAALGAPLYAGQGALLVHLDEVEARHEARDRENHAEVKGWIEKLGDRVSGKLEEHQAQIESVSLRLDGIAPIGAVGVHRRAPTPASPLQAIPQSAPPAAIAPDVAPRDISTPPRATGQLLFIRELNANGERIEQRIASRDYFERLRTVTPDGGRKWASEHSELVFEGRSLQCTSLRPTETYGGPEFLTCR